ncbi:hypothetical protein [Paenibacillus fonticola]|uniref:hypothetical protein n=1 Tax=Paenibacillus fonticola TaxID=379896 RepID=UPI000372BAA7|nr:hypothetical protein [Paenibacillus fonticola]
MSERLSRIERYGQRRIAKDRHHRSGEDHRKQPEHQMPGETKSRALRSKSSAASPKKSAKERKPSRKRHLESGLNADYGASAVAEAAPTDYRRFAEYSDNPLIEIEAPPVSAAQELPSRREVYPSQRVKLTRYFFNALLFIFIAVMVALFWWGISESPWGQSNGM